MSFFTRTTDPAGTDPDRDPSNLSTPSTPSGRTRPSSQRRRQRLRLVAAVSAVAVLASGTAVYAQAHKSVTLDVDGVSRSVTTFAGSVDGLLEEQDVTLADRDLVTPAGALREGADIVVRHAREVTVTVDGEHSAVWTTALTADEALESLRTRGTDVRLVASRSAERGAPSLGLELTLDGPADVQVDGTTLTAPDGSTTIAEVLAGLGVTLGELDTVSVRPGDGGRVTVVVSRVVVQDVTTLVEVAPGSVRKDDATLLVGRTAVATRAVPGQRTVVERVTTVDGVETAREPVSDVLTTAPVDGVVRVGTKPKPAAAATAAATAAAASEGSPVTAGGDADGLNWAALAACESGGRPTAVSASGKYHGLYQFSVATWQGVGGSGLPSAASADEQTARAKMLYNRSGAGQWPTCGSRLFG